MSMNLWKIEQLCKENFALGAASRDEEIAKLKLKLNDPVLLSEWQQLEKERDQLRELTESHRQATFAASDVFYPE